MTNISEQGLNEFKAIYEKHYDIKLTDSEFSELAERFIALIKQLLVSNHERLGKK